VAPRIEEILLQKQVNALFDDWLRNLRKQGDIEVLDPELETPESGAGEGGVASGRRDAYPSGAKAPVDFAGFMYGLKPVPFTGLSFSAACKAHINCEALAARLKSFPVTKPSLSECGAGKASA
jgi:hypothetical protein